MSDSVPAVSVVVPTFNRGAVLIEAVTSALSQDFRDLEVVVVDDGSTDDTGARLATIADSRLRCHRLATNRGYPEALNAGMGLARAPLIAWLDSDDVWQHDKLGRQVSVLAGSPQIEVVYGAYWTESDAARTLATHAWVEHHTGNLLAPLSHGNFIATSTVLLRRSLIDRVGGLDPGLPCLQDWDLWLRCAPSTRFGYVADPVATIRITSGGVNDVDDLALATALVAIVQRNSAAFAVAPRKRARHLHAAGHLLCRAGRVGPGRPYLLRAARMEPGRPRYALRAALSLLGAPAYQAASRLYDRLRGRA